MKISNEGVMITERFFKAIGYLVEDGHFRGLKTFCDLYDINRRNLQFLRENPSTSVLKPELIAILVRDFNVSPFWLLNGQGAVFTDAAKTKK